MQRAPGPLFYRARPFSLLFASRLKLNIDNKIYPCDQLTAQQRVASQNRSQIMSDRPARNMVIDTSKLVNKRANFTENSADYFLLRGRGFRTCIDNLAGSRNAFARVARIPIK